MSTESLIKYFILRNPKNQFQMYFFRFGCAYKRIIVGIVAING